MTLALEVLPDADSAARRVAEIVVERARGRRFAFALSRAPVSLLQALASGIDDWDRVELYQVDERISAPIGSYERNASALIRLPRAVFGSLRLMPVEEQDLDAAADAYARELPPALDLVHLGLGPDGHTASLVPGDSVLDARDRRVAVTGEYQSFRRMTLTYPALEAAREIVWLVTRGEKADALARLLARDASIPAARIENPAQTVVADEAALAGRTSVR